VGFIACVAFALARLEMKGKVPKVAGGAIKREWVSRWTSLSARRYG